MREANDKIPDTGIETFTPPQIRWLKQVQGDIRRQADKGVTPERRDQMQQRLVTLAQTKGIF
jgi:hypothetical protein